MSRFASKITDRQIPSSVEWADGTAAEASGHKAKSCKAYWLPAILMLALAPLAARSASDIEIPADYRSWFHVNTLVVGKDSPQFDVLGGMHVIHVNPAGIAALKKGGPYPDGTIFMDEVHESALADGAYAEGPLKGVTIMVKDSKTYASTGGWGFQFWAGGDSKKPLVTDATKQCFECHQPKRDQDYVYSTYIP